MKKLFILFLLLLVPAFCSAGVTVLGVNCGNVELGYVSKILSVGDSITQGPKTGTAGGYRRHLQDLIGSKRSFVGQWGNVAGSASGTPITEARFDDINYTILPEYQPRHFGSSGQNIATMVDAFTRLNQLDWFSATSTQDIIIVLLGANNRKKDDGQAPPIADTSLIESEVAELLSLEATIHAHNPDIAVIFCLTTPQICEPTCTDDLWQEQWVEAFNSKLITEFFILGAANTHLVDLHSPMANEGWYDGTYSSSGDDIHPNDNGDKKIAELLYDKMISEDLL